MPVVDKTPVDGELTDTVCEFDSECNDGVFCNGQEYCDAGYCRTSVAVVCDDRVKCTIDRCSHATNSCQFTAPDEDGDGHADATCIGADGETLGDDCDDDDANRYPGNSEICSAEDPGHDEDCDPKSFGQRDEDLDGETSSECCNEDGDGELLCGSDCDDEDYRRSSDYPEICDDLDNDCDGKVDKNTKEVPWYPDLDGDHFGDPEGESVMSCAPVEGYALRATDCDDSTAAVNHAAREVCDGVDNDCDGDIDEDGVCACAPEGNVRPCACGLGQSGVQNCFGGTWNSCDCTECVTGSTDCIGELLPRICQAGRWTTLTACSGLRPICLEGECRCADGSDDCQDVLDLFRPTLLTTSPLNTDVVSPLSIVALEMSEEVSLLSAQSALSLEDIFGQAVVGTIGVSGTTVSFVPDAPLAPGMHYSLTIENTLADLSGNTMAITQSLSFETETGLAITPVSGGSTFRYSYPTLAMSPSGTTLLHAHSNASLGTSSLTWDGTSWSRVAEVIDFQAWPRVAVDDAGLAVSLFSDRLTITRQLLDEGQNTFEGEISTTSSDLFGVRATGTGEACVFYEKDAELRVQTGTTAGSWNTIQSVPNGELPINAWAFDASRKGHAALVYQGESGNHVYRSTEKFATWISASAGGPPGEAKWLATAVSDAGIATVAWVESIDTGSGYANQIVLQDLSLTGDWLGSPVQPSGAPQLRSEANPQLAYDDDGNLFLAFTYGKTLVVNRRNSAGVWGTEQIASVQDVYAITQFELRTNAAKAASVVWIQSTSNVDLWGLRYDEGWGVTQLLENSSTTVAAFSSRMQPDGSTLVVFNSTHADSQPDLFSLEF